MSEGVTVGVGPVRLPAAHRWRRLPLRSLIVGVVALGLAWLAVVADLVEPERALRSYLVAFLFVATIGLGALFFVLVQWVTRAGWSVVARRLAEPLAGALPVLLVLFVPIALGLESIYEWTRPGAGLSPGKERYFEEGAFLSRSLLYLGAWGLLGWLFRRGSLLQDEAAEPFWARRLRALSAPALVLFAFTATFAAFDWVMSLEVHWYSTIFGVYLFAGAVISGLAATILIANQLERDGTLEADGSAATRQRYLLGLLLFGFVAFWAYVAFSQFMLIWYASLPEETFWFAERWTLGWRVVSIALVVGHFAVPFLWLLPKSAKLDPVTLGRVARWLLVFHYLDLYWLVLPATAFGGPPAIVIDLLLLTGVTALFAAAACRLLTAGSLLPTGDPRLGEAT